MLKEFGLVFCTLASAILLTRLIAVGKAIDIGNSTMQLVDVMAFAMDLARADLRFTVAARGLGNLEGGKRKVFTPGVIVEEGDASFHRFWNLIK